MPTRILVADDHPLYREAVRLRLERLLPDCSVVEGGSLDEILAALAGSDARSFDIILLDIHLSDGDPGANVEKVIAAAGTIPVILMSGTASADIIKQAIARGARGFIPKTMQSELFATALSMVLGGGSYLPVEILQDSPVVPVEPADPQIMRKFDELLTNREKQVLTLVATGASNKEIGRELNLAEVTVKLHVRQILRKIGARNRSEAASIATRAAFL
ncbi:MAG TPA: response regulator transcription factor [Stellaceae bacterium]|jgi:DNA-binding NarL/FixJ family response regulator|nr:response regulator transcription factor [Stellaceae bacterium]